VACIRVDVIAIRRSGGLLEWDMWAGIDGNGRARLYKYASIRPQIRLSRVAIGSPPRHQQTTDRAHPAWRAYSGTR
jgi:hypothetical protein